MSPGDLLAAVRLLTIAPGKQANQGEQEQASSQQNKQEYAIHEVYHPFNDKEQLD